MNKKNLTRKEIGRSIYKNLGISKNLTENLVENTFKIISENLQQHSTIKIAKFVYIKLSDSSSVKRPKKEKELSITPPFPNIIIHAKVLTNKFVQNGIVTKNMRIFFTVLSLLKNIIIAN